MTSLNKVALMPRGNRVVLGRDNGGVLHVTHRCHDGTFLLKFQQDRDAYRWNRLWPGQLADREGNGKNRVSICDLTGDFRPDFLVLRNGDPNKIRSMPIGNRAFTRS